jgi:cytochrome c biogenesis protein CcmG/thiol:disulfide interchange protein DsbE
VSTVGVSEPRRTRWVVLPVVLATGALLGLLAYGVLAGGDRRSIDSALARGERPQAPSVALPSLGGRGDRTLADYRGQVVVVNFWASWCPPCRAETPMLERWQRRLRSRGGTVLGVDVLDVSSDALAFARRYGVSYPLVRDRDGAAAQRFGVAGYPETVAVDRRGRIAAIERGPVGEGFYRSRLEPLLMEER